MAEDEMSLSLLDEYSIAELQSDLEQWGNLQDAFTRYAKVIFHDVADSYATDADILCCFTLSSDLKRKDGDLVALFRLGWRHPNEMITFQLVPLPSSPESYDYEVLFKAEDLPKNEGEIYQLCYISQNEVWGASVPFEFRRASAEELLVVDSGDIAIVRSQPAIAGDLKRQLAELRKEISVIESNNSEMQDKLNEAEEKNKVLQGRLDDLEKVELVLDRLRGENQALDKAHNDAEEALKHAELRIMSLEKTVEALQQDIVHLRKQLASQIESFERKTKTSQEQNCSQEIIDALRQGKDVAVREMRSAMADNERLQTELAMATSEKEKLLQQLNGLNKTLDKFKEKKQYCEAMHQDKKEATERIEGLLAELTRLSSGAHQSSNSSEAEVLKSRIYELESKLEVKEKELHILKAQQNVPLKPNVLEESKVQNVSEVSAILADLDSVTACYREVKKDIESLSSEMSEIKCTETSLIESHKRLESRVENLQKIIKEAEQLENIAEADLHRRELTVATAKLQEKWVCILSARARQEDLEDQLEELKQVCAVLFLQKTQAEDALSAASDLPSNENEDSSLESTTVTSNQLSCARELSGTEITNSGGNLQSEVAELRERLHQAAEAYKILYQQKVVAERQLQRMQELERHSEKGTKP